MILRFTQFAEAINEAAIPVYRGSSIQPEKNIKGTAIMSELANALEQVKSGQISWVSVVAGIPTQGKRAPEYLKDVFASAGVHSSEDMYDDRGQEKNIFVDSEFVVKGLNPEKGTIIAMPYSLRRKGIEIEIDPTDVIEIFYK